MARCAEATETLPDAGLAQALASLVNDDESCIDGDNRSGRDVFLDEVDHSTHRADICRDCDEACLAPIAFEDGAARVLGVNLPSEVDANKRGGRCAVACPY